MKKIIALIAAAGCCLGLLAGCGGSSEDSSAVNSDASYQIGVIQLVQHEALDAATAGFKDALTDKLGDDVSIDVQNAAGDSNTCATIANRFVSSKVDLIMANATPALQASFAATDTIPIVATSVTDYGTALDIGEWTGATGMNVTGTSDLAPLDQQADMIKELFPDAKNVGIVYCSGEANSKYQSDKMQEYLGALGYTCTEYTFADSNDVQAVTKTACEGSDVLYIPTDNTAASCTGTIDGVASAAGIPIVTGEEGICKGCGVATLSISYYDLGYQTGLMAYEILVNGADPAAMDVEFATDLTKEYVAERCDALNITVPDGYEAIAAEDAE